MNDPFKPLRSPKHDAFHYSPAPALADEVKAYMKTAAAIRRNPFYGIGEACKPVRLSLAGASKRLAWTREPVTDEISRVTRLSRKTLGPFVARVSEPSGQTFPNCAAWLAYRRLQLGIATAGEATAYQMGRAV